MTITPPTQIAVKAQRVRKTAGPPPSITTVGDSETISLPFVVASFNGKPQPDGMGNITYTYRTHDLSDLEIFHVASPGL